MSSISPGGSKPPICKGAEPCGSRVDPVSASTGENGVRTLILAGAAAAVITVAGFAGSAQAQCAWTGGYWSCAPAGAGYYPAYPNPYSTYPAYNRPAFGW